MLQEDFEQDKVRLERECDQLLFEQKKLHHKLGVSKKDIIKKLKREIETRKKAINTINVKMEQLAILELGSEIIEKEIDAIVHVEVGSKWSEVSRTTSIVI